VVPARRSEGRRSGGWRREEERADEAAGVARRDAAGVGGALQWLIPLTESPAIVRLVLYGVVLLGVYVVAALLLGVPEARTVWQRMPLIGRRLNTD